MLALLMDSRLPDRFWRRVFPCPTSGCWLWTGSVDRWGYARFKIGKRDASGHRHSYLSLVGEIGAGLEIDHLCRVRHCVNPSHMEAVTPKENNRRSGSQGALNAAKTHCPKGHTYDEANTRFCSGRRICKACCAARQRLHRRNQRARRSQERAA